MSCATHTSAFLLVGLSLTLLVGCSRDAPSVEEERPEPISLSREFTESSASNVGQPGASETGSDLGGVAAISDGDLFLTEAEEAEASKRTADRRTVSADNEAGFAARDPKLDAEVASLLDAARSHLDEQQATAAAKAAWQAWKLHPTNPKQIVDIGRILLRTRKLGPAIVMLDDAHQQGLANDKALILLAQATLAAAQLEESPAKTLELLDKSATVLMQLEQDGALETYGKAGAQLLLASLTDRAKLAASLGRTDEAIETMQQLHRRGFSQLSALLAQSDFDIIRDRPAFVEQMRAFRSEIYRRMRPQIQRLIEATPSFDFDFSLNDIEGHRISLSDYRGKLVIVDFWGTWCGPCRMTVPHLARLSREYQDQLEVIGIAYEKTLPGREKAKVREFVRQNAVPYTCAIGDDATKRKVPDFNSFPTLLFLDADGQVKLKLLGYHGYEQLDAVVNLLLEEPNAL